MDPILKPICVAKREEVDDEHEEALSPLARVFHQPNSNVYIICILGFKTQVDPQLIKASLVHSLLKNHRFSSLQVVDKKNGEEMKWVETTVDLDNHVIVPNLKDTDICSGDKFVEDYVSNLSKTKISMSIPMWDIHVLNVHTSNAESVCVLRAHHSLGDGTSLISMLLASSRKVSDPEALPTINANTRKDQKPKNVMYAIWKSLTTFWNTFVGVVLFLATILSLLKDTETPIKGSIGVHSTPRRFVHRMISLDDIKLVKNALNMTVNDVMVGVTQAALSRYLNKRYGEGDDCNNYENATKIKNHLPKNIRLRATLFMNIRPPIGLHAIADMMEKGSKVKWGNKIGYVILPLTIALHEDPLDYAHQAKATMEKKKNSLEAVYNFLVADFLHRFVRIKGGRFPSQTTMWYSNVPGPQEEISYSGYPLAYIAPSCYGQPNALLVHFVSYADKMNIMLSVDEAVVPNPHSLCDDFEESFKLIKNATVLTNN